LDRELFRKEIKNLKKKKNVIGGSLVPKRRITGSKEIDGTEVLRVYVKRKEPLCSLAATDVLPSKTVIGDKEIEVDVVDIGEIVALDTEYPDPKKRYRPLRMGSSTMNSRSGGACSLGAFAIDNKTGNLVQLSNQHCFGLSNDANLGDKIVQPSRLDDGNYQSNYTGEFIRGVSIKFTGGILRAIWLFLMNLLFGYVPDPDINTVDVSCASINEDVETTMETLNGVTIIGCKDPDEFATNIWAYGRTSGYSHGSRYLDLDGFVNVNYGDKGEAAFEDVVIGSQNATFKCIPGDSGSPWFEDDKIVGLRFAGSNTVWIGCKWSNIERELDVRFP